MAKKSKVAKVLHEYKAGKLHSGSKKGPKVKNPKQAVAIALSEARKAGEPVEAPKKGKKKVTKSEKTLHREEEKQHEKAEKAMKADEKIHEKIEKKHKAQDKRKKK